MIHKELSFRLKLDLEYRVKGLKVKIGSMESYDDAEILSFNHRGIDWLICVAPQSVHINENGETIHQFWVDLCHTAQFHKLVLSTLSEYLLNGASLEPLRGLECTTVQDVFNASSPQEALEMWLSVNGTHLGYQLDGEPEFNEGCTPLAEVDVYSVKNGKYFAIDIYHMDDDSYCTRWDVQSFWIDRFDPFDSPKRQIEWRKQI